MTTEEKNPALLENVLVHPVTGRVHHTDVSNGPNRMKQERDEALALVLELQERNARLERECDEVKAERERTVSMLCDKNRRAAKMIAELLGT